MATRVAPREPLPFDAERLVAFHRDMLRDGRRSRAFHRALAAARPMGKVVLDIGAGTGVWAVLAARMGARRVVAVEKDARLKPVIARLADENGVDDRVEVVVGDSRELALGRTFDLVISETVGHLGVDEDIASIMADARRRFLRAGGAMIPRTVSIMAAPVAGFRLDTPIRTDSFRAVATHVASLEERHAPKPVARPARLLRMDLRSCGPSPRLEALSAAWRLTRATVDAVAVWVEMTLAPGVTYSTRQPGSAWKPVLFGIDPIERGSGLLRFQINLSQPKGLWRASFPGWRETRHYSGLFAVGALGPAPD